MDIILEVLACSHFFNLFFKISITTHLETPFPWLLIPLELTAISQVPIPSLCDTYLLRERAGDEEYLDNFPGMNFKYNKIKANDIDSRETLISTLFVMLKILLDWEHIMKF